MSLFDDLTQLPEDPIFGVNHAFAKDPRKGKINLSIGAYRTEELLSYTLPSVLEAKKQLMRNTSNKEYLPIEGEQGFREEIAKLSLGKYHKEFYTGGSLGGTGALNLIGQLLKQACVQSLYIPDPSWPNHKGIFCATGLKTYTYPYLASATDIDLEGILNTIQSVDGSAAFIFHANCHNPSGCDPTKEAWDKIAQALKDHNHFVILDMAYHGFGEGLEEDQKALHIFMKYELDMAVCYSCSKNFGLYGERVGALCIRSKSKEILASHIKNKARTTYSNPARFGEEIVATILQDRKLKSAWEKELSAMRRRITSMREKFYEALISFSDKKGLSEETWPDIRKQKGFFGFMGITAKEVELLEKDYAIYMPKSGRVNMAGLCNSNIDTVAAAFVEVRSG